MAVSNFNPAGNIQYAGYSQERLSDRNRFLIETLLADSGIYYGGLEGAVAAPTPTPTPPTAPAPSPTPSPAPAPAPTTSQGSTTVNTFVRLALSEVKPGDLITAGFANNLIEAIMALENRVRALEGAGKATPTPTPSQPDPTPTPSGGGASLSGGGRTEIGRAAPTIETVTGETVRGKGVDITVTGDNLGEGVVERVLLGATVIAPKGIKYSRTGFSFTTTATIVKNAKNRITVVTSGGEDSAALSTGKKAPVL